MKPSILIHAPLDFYPSWYEAARRGVLLLVFGRRHEGMSTDTAIPDGYYAK